MAADYRVTVAGGGDKSGSSWANAMDLAAWDTHIGATVVAGDRYFVKQGTYALAGHLSTGRDGSAVLPVEVIGVVTGAPENPTPADWAFATDRPLIAAGGLDIAWHDYWLARNLRITTSDANGFLLQDHCGAINCKVTGTTRGFTLNGHYNYWIDCEATAPSGTAFYMGSGKISGTVYGCYAHDSVLGFDLDDHYTRMMFCIVDTCTTGVDIHARMPVLLTNNTLYKGTTGLKATTAYIAIILNNIISDFTTPASWDTEQKSNVFDFNDWWNSATPTKVTKGPNALAIDPAFRDAPNGDFRPGAWQSLLGFPGEFPGGLSNGAGLIVGAVQPRRAVQLINRSLV